MNLEVGSTIGDYEVIGVLGAGGMGRVYKVRNVISDRVEAMKVLLPDLGAEPDLADRFLREIKVQASLEHPNIAALHTAVRAGNQLLMLMELVDGVTLEQKLKAGPLPPAQAADYIGQTLAALEYAHAHGVVHRDIKPANMILTPRGTVKLLDFGIAKATSERQLTMTGTTMGSLYYMSPEQIQGAKNLDARSDLYSVGVSLYELVTGKHPFDGDSQYSIMASHLESAPVPPITIDPHLPQDLNDIILLSVAKDPAERFQTAGAFRNALGNIASSPQAPTVTAAPPKPAIVPQTAPAAPRASHRGMWMGIGAVAAVAALVAFIQFAPKGHKAASQAAAPVVLTPSTPALAPVPESTPMPPAQQPASTPVTVPVHEQNASPVHQAAQAQTQAQAPAVQVAPPAVVQPSSPPPPVQTSPAASVPPPVDTAALAQVSDQAAMLGARASAVRSSLQGLQRSQTAAGMNLRGDMQEASSLMTTYLDSANAALRAGNSAQAKSFLSKAETQVEKLEKFLGR